MRHGLAQLAAALMAVWPRLVLCSWMSKDEASMKGEGCSFWGHFKLVFPPASQTTVQCSCCGRKDALTALREVCTPAHGYTGEKHKVGDCKGPDYQMPC